MPEEREAETLMRFQEIVFRFFFFWLRHLRWLFRRSFLLSTARVVYLRPHGSCGSLMKRGSFIQIGGSRYSTIHKDLVLPMGGVFLYFWVLLLFRHSLCQRFFFFVPDTYVVSSLGAYLGYFNL